MSKIMTKQCCFGPFHKAFRSYPLTPIKSTLSSLKQFLATESPLKMMKNAFYFTFKALLVLKGFKFLSWIFGLVEKRLDQKDKLKFRIYEVTNWLKQTIAIHILTRISRSKCNQAMKFGQLIEYNMRNIFFEKSYTKCGENTISRPFSKMPKLNISLD